LPYTVEIKGTAYKNFQLSDIEVSIRQVLEAKFGKNAKVKTKKNNRRTI
jgi:hypothetical protein